MLRRRQEEEEEERSLWVLVHQSKHSLSLFDLKKKNSGKLEKNSIRVNCLGFVAVLRHYVSVAVCVNEWEACD